MDLFTVVCRREHATFKVFIAAETPEEAVAEAKQRGHDVDQVMKAGVWTRGREAEAEGRLRPREVRERGGCSQCGYDLDGLEIERGWVTCPECGTRQMRGVGGVA